MPAPPAPGPSSSPALPAPDAGAGSGRRGRSGGSLPPSAVNVALSVASDLAHHLVLALALLGPALCWPAWMARRLEAPRTSARGMSRAILAGAFLPRPLLLPLPSTLSDDALRYLWGGKVAAAGANPYALPPAAEQLTSLRDEIWRHLPHREIRTIHPPPSIAAFSIAARPPNPIMAALGVVATTATPASEGLVPAKLAPGAALAPPRGRRAVAEAAASLLGRWPSG